MNVYFANNGDFNTTAMLTMGLSAKEPGSIGMFGTGFKYAVAIILSHGGEIDISTVSGQYKFKPITEVHRGKEFQIVYMNDQNAGFTTHLGVNWEPWMAFRELYCNAKDEKGVITTDFDEAQKYDTIVRVNCQAITEAYHSRDKYILEDSKPLASSPHVEVHKHNGSPFLYYRGIAVKSLEGVLSFSYNILGHMSLTEERIAADDRWISHVRQFYLHECSDHAMLRVVLATNGSHEDSEINFNGGWTTSVSKHFEEVFDSLKGTVSVSESARKLMKALRAEQDDFTAFEPSAMELKMVEKAKATLLKIRINIDDYPVKYVVGLGKGTMGRAMDGQIFITPLAFNMGTAQLCGTLLEEWVHLNTGCADFDRRMQNWLFDKVVSLAQEIAGEPL